MENVLKFVLIGAGVVICIGLITWVFLMKNESESTMNSGMKEMSTLNSEMADSGKTMYDGLEVSGSQVADTIDKFEDELSTSFSITVKTLANGTTGKVYSTKPVTYPAISTDDYINPRGQFLGSITYNTNDVISGLVFTQQK